MKLLLCGHKEIYQGGAEVYWTNIIASLSKRGINLRTVYLAKQNNNTMESIFNIQFQSFREKPTDFVKKVQHMLDAPFPLNYNKRTLLDY